jgi:TonB family protein
MSEVMKKSFLVAMALACALSVTDHSRLAGAVMRQRPLRVALVGFNGATVDAPGADEQLRNALRAALAQSAQVALLDSTQVEPAATGVGYDGSINMSRDEARRLGAAIGCDFFITGKRDAFTRSEAKNESHEEALAGVMIVDARTGELAAFDFIDEKAATRAAALETLSKTLAAHASSYVERLIAYRDRRDRAPNAVETVERVQDLPDADSAARAGFKPPEFLNRVKPEYTAEAERADITATVEASAVFRADGTVGEITITRWAGFGLDESAARAIRQLKFKPATRDGQPVSVRAAVRYNFRRVSAPAK